MSQMADANEAMQQILEMSRELIELQRQFESVHRSVNQQIREMQTRLVSIERTVAQLT